MIGAVNHDLDDAVGQIYVKKYFPASSKVQAKQTVDNIFAALSNCADQLDWMTPATKQKAKTKIAAVHVDVSHPET